MIYYLKGVPYTDGEAWTEGMGFPAKKSWHAWTYTSIDGNADQGTLTSTTNSFHNIAQQSNLAVLVAGYATSYDVSSLKGTGSFEFVTVKGGRHEVPESAPGQALELLSRLVEGTPF